jgi:hypothetical protein
MGLVWITLTKDIQHTGPFMKLHNRKVGPCKVLKRINDNAYIQGGAASTLANFHSFNIQQSTSHTLPPKASSE